METEEDKNFNIAQTIVDNYEFEQTLTPQERRVLVEAILKNGALLKRDLSIMINNFMQLGFDEQAAFGAIMNFAVHKKVLKEQGLGYGELLEKDDAWEKIRKYIGSIETRVSRITILKAVSEKATRNERDAVKRELIELGVDSYYIKQKDFRNLYMAKGIIEEYALGREVTSEEKRFIIQKILDNALLDKDRLLSSLMRKFQGMGLGEQDIYGTIINLGVNGKVLEEAGYGYADLLMNTNNACKTIADYSENMQTKVTDITIEKALSKSKNIMKKAVKSQRNKGTQAVTRVQLENLVRGEKSEEISDGQTTIGK